MGVGEGETETETEKSAAIAQAALAAESAAATHRFGDKEGRVLPDFVLFCLLEDAEIRRLEIRSVIELHELS